MGMVIVRHRDRRYPVFLDQETVIAGLEGFEPTTAGLRVLCATWLRHRPTKISTDIVVINLKIGERLF